MKKRALGAAIVLMAMYSHAAIASPVSPTSKPRETVAAIATAISENYFDVGKGERIAKALRAEASAGKFDRYGNPAELATALALRLRPSDAHFNVLYSERRASPAGAGGQAPRLPPTELQRRNSFGFQQVEILPGNIGYLRLGQFADIAFDDPHDPAREQADAALALTRHADALIIDLRGSPGGRPAMVGYLISAFVENATPIYNVFHWRDGESEEAPDVPYPQPRTKQQVYLLTGPRTASAAEGFSYTLQAAKRATVIGEPTAGGANPGGFVDVGGGFSVFVSSGSPVNPITGTNWEGTGVIPDVRVAAGDALMVAKKLALQDALKHETEAAPRLDQRWALQAFEPAKDLPGEVLRRYAGSYQGMDVRLEHGRLQAQQKGRPAYELLAITETEFAVLGEPGLRVHFITQGHSDVVASELVTSAGPRMRFARSN